MMMEQQMTLKSDYELQNRWKTCVLTTCYAYRMVERVKEAIDTLYDIVRHIINNIAEILKEALKPVVETFKDLIYYLEDSCVSDKIYLQSYPQYVNNLKVSTKGFLRPVTHCARSGC